MFSLKHVKNENKLNNNKNNYSTPLTYINKNKNKKWISNQFFKIQITQLHFTFHPKNVFKKILLRMTK